MGQVIDNAIAIRIIYLLVHAFKNWDAYKLGIIDDNGVRTSKAIKSQKEKDSWTMLHRLVSRLKRIVALAPGGKSLLARLTTAYLLVREGSNYDLTDDELIESYLTQLNSITRNQAEEAISLFEEIASTTALIPVARDNNPSTLLGPKPKKKVSYKKQNMMFRRQELPDTTIPGV